MQNKDDKILRNYPREGQSEFSLSIAHGGVGRGAVNGVGFISKEFFRLTRRISLSMLIEDLGVRSGDCGRLIALIGSSSIV